LAYLLNKNLSTNFRKLKNELTIEIQQVKASFSTFKFENINYDFDWYLIA
ncbi:MAG: IPExxxVDY family protein, partial [Flavobacteriaceae bacterium CG_4_8_14_3_um_filter_31_8]